MTLFQRVRADIDRFVGQYTASEGEQFRLRVQTSRAAHFRCLLRVLVSQYGLQALLAYRFGKWLTSAPSHPGGRAVRVLLRPAHALMTAYVRAAYDIHLDGSAEIGPGLFISHIGDIRIRGCRIGDGCSLHQRVEIEPLVTDGIGPNIGNGVWLGPHSKVRGPVQIGDGATVGTGAVVLQDVPAGALVVGDPARKLPVQFDNRDLLEG